MTGHRPSAEMGDGGPHLQQTDCHAHPLELPVSPARGGVMGGIIGDGIRGRIDFGLPDGRRGHLRLNPNIPLADVRSSAVPSQKRSLDIRGPSWLSYAFCARAPLHAGQKHRFYAFLKNGGI